MHRTAQYIDPRQSSDYSDSRHKVARDVLGVWRWITEILLHSAIGPSPDAGSGSDGRSRVLPIPTVRREDVEAVSPEWTDQTKQIRMTADELRAESLTIVAVGAGAAALVWFAVLGDPPRPATWLPPLGMIALSAISLVLARFRASAGAVLLSISLVLGNSLLLWIRPDRPAAYFYVAVVFAVGAVLGPLPSVVTGVGCSFLIGAAVLDPHVALDVTSALYAAGLLWLGLLLTWAAAFPVRAALVWAWDSYLDALRRSEELRDRQGELNRVLSSLNETCYRLEVANQELARARAAAEEARQLKTEFATNISHELRTPLNLIVGFSEILMNASVGEGGASLSPTMRADVDVIHRNALHLSNLIDDVLDLSQVDAGRMGLHKERACLSTIVAEAVSAISRLYEARGLTLANEVPDDLPALFVDRTRVRQVLINLLNNAARFTTSGGATVRARQDGQNIVVEVADTGIGIAPDDLPKVFEEFRQLDGSTRRPHDGSGLGLAICKRFVELHGGAIWAESERGKGTVFTFSLPLIGNVASATLRPEWDTWVRLPTTNEPERAVVLVAPDEQIHRLFQRYLDAYRILPATQVEDVQDIFRRMPVHGVVLTTPPRSDLSEQLGRLRSAPRGVPVITCSLPTTRSLGEGIGVAEYLIKPISRDRLLQTLNRVARKARVVLVVDDDPEMVRLLARMIRSGSRRHQVLRAYGGYSALELLHERRPDVVILDLVMPDLDGYGVLREMRRFEDLRTVPVIAVTARGYEAETVAAGALSITREGGLSVGELMTCLRSSLDAITKTSSTAVALPASLPP